MQQRSMKPDDLSSVTQSQLDFHDFSNSFREDEDGMLGEDRAAAAPPLQGRDNEKRELFEAYNRVLQTQESQVVFVHGTSGQGKTSLIDTLRGPVCESNGHFCAGKFFQDPGIQEPYSAITAAFSDLCDLVVQSPDFDEKTRARIRERLGHSGRLLSRSVNLSPFYLGDSVDLHLDGNNKAKAVTFARFRVACKSFLVAMASKKHPVVIFLDDVQWIDDGSKKLVEIMNDDDIRNVLFVLSYRDEEASAVEGILESARKKTGVSDIQLSNLGLQSVSQVLAWHLGPVSSNIDELAELTELALQRTGGNPFFLSLFLEVLETEGLLLMDGTCPTFDVNKIRSSIMVAESIADLLSQKVNRMTPDVKHVLAVASLLGYSFDEEVLFEVPGIVKVAASDTEKHEKVVGLLMLASDEGFIERVRDGYQFAHDKVQSTFQSLMDEHIKEHYHLLIGKIYLARKTEGSIYNAAVHLNVAPGFLSTKVQWIRLARTNLEASQYCKQLSAFDRAISLLQRGLELLDSIDMKWSEDCFELSLELTESLARMALLVGDCDMCFDATGEAMLHIETKRQKVNMLLINVECRMASSDMEGSIKASTEALFELGVKLPRKPTMGHVLLKFVKLKVVMTGKTDEALLGLPCVEDESWAVAIKLLIHVAFYGTQINKMATARYTSLLAMELTLRHGLSTYAAPALAIFASALLQLGEMERAYNLGMLALSMMEQCPSREGDCPTIGFVNTLLLHWKDPIHVIRGPLVGAAAAGFEQGDVIYSMFSITQGINMDMVSGVHLEVIEESLQCQYRNVHDLGQSKLLVWLDPFMQAVAILRDSSTHWSQLSLMSGACVSGASASHNFILVVATALVQRARLANVFGYHHIARETFQELEPFLHSFRFVFVFNIVCWEACVAYYEGFIADGKRKHLRKARKYKKHLEQADVLGPNALAYLSHLKLKETFMQRRRRRTKADPSHNDETLSLLDCEVNAISLLDESCTPCFVVARAYVDAGSIAERMGRNDEAVKYFELAREVYSEKWGAFAPAAWVEEKYERLQRQQPRESTFDTQDLLVGGIVQFGEVE